MSLPTSKQISWREWKENYKIETPTFSLTPVEKPDMSPFLIHMTGINEILSILQGVGAPAPLAQGFGYLQANVPEYDQKGAFDARVVCFSESPTFALDFFRYRSFKRWKADQSYGIGFDKDAMVRIGTRPVIYVEDAVNRNLINLHLRVRDNHLVISDDATINQQITSLLQSIYPLLYPLLENNDEQGFMWEREWRFADPSGLVFNHSDIRIICCPPNEEAGIRKALSPNASETTFVHTWQEYDDVTDYLMRKEETWQIDREKYEESVKAAKPGETKQHLQSLIQQYTLAFNSLDSYEEYVSGVSNEVEQLKEQKKILGAKIEQLFAELKELEKKKKKPK